MTMNVWDEQAKNRKRYEDTRGRDFTSPEHCTICGKALGKNPECVEVALDGTVIPEGDARSGSDEHSQGWWPVGSECVKRLR
jgi:hypothetical protein